MFLGAYSLRHLYILNQEDKEKIVPGMLHLGYQKYAEVYLLNLQINLVLGFYYHPV